MPWRAGRAGQKSQEAAAGAAGAGFAGAGMIAAGGGAAASILRSAGVRVCIFSAGGAGRRMISCRRDFFDREVGLEVETAVAGRWR